MLYFKEIVESILNEAQMGVPVTRSGQPLPTQTLSVSGGFNPTDPFKPQILVIIKNLYPSENSEVIFDQQFFKNANRLTSSGYQSISDKELLTLKKYWAIIDLGYFVIDELAVKRDAKNIFQELCKLNKTLKDKVSDSNIIDKITDGYNEVLNYKTVNDYKNYQNYRIRALVVNKTTAITQALGNVGTALGSSFGKYFKIQ